jgi:hypothetical protein
LEIDFSLCGQISGAAATREKVLAIARGLQIAPDPQNAAT